MMLYKDGTSATTSCSRDPKRANRGKQVVLVGVTYRRIKAVIDTHPDLRSLGALDCPGEHPEMPVLLWQAGQNGPEVVWHSFKHQQLGPNLTMTENSVQDMGLLTFAVHLQKCDRGYQVFRP